MAYKNTPLTGLSVKQIQILVEARNRPGVHTYYPGGHDITLSSYRCRIQHRIRNMLATFLVERNDTLGPAIITMWKKKTTFQPSSPRVVVSMSDNVKIYIYTAYMDIMIGDIILQRKVNNKIIFQLTGTYQLLKFYIDGDEIYQYDNFVYVNLELYKFNEIAGNGATLNYIIFHEYHLQPSKHPIDSREIIDQDEYIAAGCYMSLDLPVFENKLATVLIDQKHVTPPLTHVDFSFVFYLMGSLMENRQTKQQTYFTPVVTPISTNKIAMSIYYYARDMTATLVTL